MKYDRHRKRNNIGCILYFEYVFKQAGVKTIFWSGTVNCYRFKECFESKSLWYYDGSLMFGLTTAPGRNFAWQIMPYLKMYSNHYRESHTYFHDFLNGDFLFVFCYLCHWLSLSSNSTGIICLFDVLQMKIYNKVMLFI